MLLGVVGCGNSPAPAGAAASCAALKLTLVGELDGQPVNAQVDVLSSSSQQVTVPYTLDVGYTTGGTGGTLEVVWTTAISYRQMTAATGFIVMPAGAPHAGETLCASGGATRRVGRSGDAPPDNDYFTFDTLSVGPDCPGTVVLAGSIDGCYGENMSSGI